jgi:hypothetical protein
MKTLVTAACSLVTTITLGAQPTPILTPSKSDLITRDATLEGLARIAVGGGLTRPVREVRDPTLEGLARIAVGGGLTRPVRGPGGPHNPFLNQDSTFRITPSQRR